MGYYTKYKLHYEADDETSAKIMQYMSKKNLSLDYLSRAKWYEHETDMREISAEFPDKLFILSGSGEESGDIWKKYFLRGKMQYCPAKIVFETFDPEKLT